MQKPQIYMRVRSPDVVTQTARSLWKRMPYVALAFPRRIALRRITYIFVTAERQELINWKYIMIFLYRNENRNWRYFLTNKYLSLQVDNVVSKFHIYYTKFLSNTDNL